jgi:hypothetical protein
VKEHLTSKSAAQELAELIFHPEDRGYKRVPFIIGQQQYAAEFIDTLNSLTAGFWAYTPTAYREDSPEVLIGAIKFLKSNDAIRFKYDSLADDQQELNYFAEGLTADRACQPEDLERIQPLMAAAIKEIRRD